MAWTADVPAVLARPEFVAFYLAAAAHHPGAFPTGPAEAALAFNRALPAPADPHVPDTTEYAGRA
ncbi:hypothetical protein [Streptomyces murinus]|uniref:hypothetical protein n=1 Tax=Streptomyces murinus TaxID=33900 RepID=UPI0037F90C38